MRIEVIHYENNIIDHSNANDGKTDGCKLSGIENCKDTKLFFWFRNRNNSFNGIHVTIEEFVHLLIFLLSSEVILSNCYTTQHIGSHING